MVYISIFRNLRSKKKMNKSDIEAYLKRLEIINTVIKKQDEQTNKENIENKVYGKKYDPETGTMVEDQSCFEEEDNTFSYVGVFVIDRLGNEENHEVAIDSQFGPEDKQYGVSFQFLEESCILLDSDGQVWLVDYKDINRITTNY